MPDCRQTGMLWLFKQSENKATNTGRYQFWQAGAGSYITAGRLKRLFNWLNKGLNHFSVLDALVDEHTSLHKAMMTLMDK